MLIKTDQQKYKLNMAIYFVEGVSLNNSLGQRITFLKNIGKICHMNSPNERVTVSYGYEIMQHINKISRIAKDRWV